MTETSSNQGLTCPACAQAVPVPEGARLVTCPACRQRLFVQGDRGVRRWQLRRVVTRDQAQQTVTGFFGGMNKAGDLRRQAEIEELFLVYLPFWRVMAQVAGWRLGRVHKDKDSTKPIEVEELEEMQLNDAAPCAQAPDLAQVMESRAHPSRIQRRGGATSMESQPPSTR